MSKVYDVIVIGAGNGGLTVQLPAPAALDAVGHGQEPALPGGEVVVEVGVPGEQDPALAVGADLGGDAGVQSLGPGEAQRTVDEVVLIVYYEEIAVHGNSSLEKR